MVFIVQMEKLLLKKHTKSYVYFFFTWYIFGTSIFTVSFLKLIPILYTAFEHFAKSLQGSDKYL